MNEPAGRQPADGVGPGDTAAAGPQPADGVGRGETSAGRQADGVGWGDTGAAGREPAPAGRWVDVGAESDLPPGSAVRVSVGDAEVAVFNVDGQRLAVEGRCLHKGGVLAEGLVSGGVVTCPLHWWRYDLRTGERLGAPDLRLARYPVRATGGRVEVFLPPAPPTPESLRDRLLAAARHRSPTRPPAG